MRFSLIAKNLGSLLMLYSLSLWLPMGVSLWYQDLEHWNFIFNFSISLMGGLLLWYPLRTLKLSPRNREGFLIMVLFWVLLGVMASFPFLLAQGINISFTDALFEAVSGVTTTGATVLTQLDSIPPSLLYYRQQLQWVGGYSIVLMAVAILPSLGIGAAQLYQVDGASRVSNTRGTPHFYQTSKTLTGIYLSLTVLCAFFYWIAGMSIFDAVGHAYSTVSLGGFSTHDANLGFYIQPSIKLVSMVFMLLAGINFMLHLTAWRKRRWLLYLQDPECQFYLYSLLFGSLGLMALLVISQEETLLESIILGGFVLVSTLTTAGFSTPEQDQWPLYMLLIILIAGFAGGCVGSTGGGLKMGRILVIIKQGLRELKILIHPNAVLPLKLGTRSISSREVEAVWAFFAVYLTTYLIFCMILLSTGLDFITAFSAVGACLNNLGNGLGQVTEHYQSLPSFTKHVLTAAMLVGRLEVLPLLLLFTALFWRY